MALWGVVALLIGYGSLYPFRFRFPGLPLESLWQSPRFDLAATGYGLVSLVLFVVNKTGVVI